MPMPALGPPAPRVALVVAAIVVAGGVALRIYAALGDFWLDEILSLAIAQQATSLWDLIHFKVDNNHLLNTMLMRLLGEQAYWPVYRVPSIIAGGVSIAVAGMIARRWSAPAETAAMILIALSLPLVLYGSEARGYSLAVMFMLLAIWLQMRLMTADAPSPRPSPRGRGGMTVAFWACAALGMLSHPLFLQPYLALLAWAMGDALTTRDTPARVRLVRLVALHLPPLLFAGFMYFAHWRGMQVAGGEINAPWRVIASAAAMTIGWPRDFVAFTMIGAGVVVLMLLASIFSMLRRRDPFAVFALLAIVIVPALLVIILRPAVLYERYFLLPMTVALLVLARWTGGTESRIVLDPPKGCGRLALSFGVLLLIAGFNLVNCIPLLTIGRGQYLAAMEHIAAHTAGSEIVIGSDHDFRNRIVIEFYSRYLDKTVRYVPEKQWPSPDGQWFIVHGLGHDEYPREVVTDHAGVRWQLEGRYECADLSGWRWFVYRRASP